MHTQSYTNLLLTVIALSLVVIAFKEIDLFENVNANRAYSPQMLPLNEDGSVNVRLTNLDEVDVNISGISTFDELDVKVVDVEGGELEVKLEE